jgi:septum formation protein
MRKIILASASPRRKELLQRIGLKFEVVPSSYKEDIRLCSDPHALARRISLEKGRAVAGKHGDALVIAADTLVVLGGQMMGKPGTEDEARSMLRTISGRRHSVITGFSIIDSGENKSVSGSVETRVYIKKLTSTEIDAYVKSGEPLDKAGAYAIQGLGAVLVHRIEGDYSNVIGLPLGALAESLKEFGINIL